MDSRGEGEGGEEENEEKEEERKKRRIRNKIETITYLSKITLNINDLRAPIKIHWVAEWIRKLSIETYLRMKDAHRLNVKTWKKYFIKWEF